MEKTTGVRFTALDYAGSCNRRRELQSVKLRSDSTTRMERAGIEKHMVLLALAARAVRPLMTEADLADLYEESVLLGLDSGLSDEQMVAYRLLSRMAASYRRMFGEDTDDIVPLLSCDVPGAVRDLIAAAFKRLDWPTEQTRNVASRRSAAKISRYLAWETRTAMFVEPKEVKIAGQSVEVAPDYVFDDGMGEITVVRLNTGKPRLTQKSRNSGLSVKSANNSLMLYSLWQYGTDYIAEEGERVVACAISLMRADDDRDQMNLTFTAPSGAKNVITLTPPNENEAAFHEHFKELMEDFIGGADIECNPTDCSMCHLYPVCSFKKEPLRVDDEFAVRKASAVTLSPAQNDIIYFRDGVARVNAGAGAGKTLVMSMFVTTLLDDGVDPKDILCITYTKGAADELSSRIAALVDDFGIDDVDPSDVMCTTFNGFGARIIDEKWSELGFDRPPVIVDVERKQLIEELLNIVTIPGLDYETWSTAGSRWSKSYGALDIVCAAFDAIKARGAAIPDVDDLRADLDRYKAYITDDAAYQAMIDLFYVYEDKMKAHGYIEFADQEDLLWQLIARDPYFLEDIMPFRYVVVDEFQDSSALQMELVKQFTYAKDFRALVACGDDSQSIFSYRGAVPDNLIHFFEKMGVDDGIDLPLLENYRCREPIIDFANKVNARNVHRVEKDLIATRGPGKPVTVHGFHRRKDEVDFIVEQVQAKISEGVKLEDIAILAATGGELGEIASRLNDEGIPGVLMAPEQCLENSRIAGAIGLRRALKSPGNSADIAAYLNAVSGGKATTMSADELSDAIEAFATEIVEKYRNESPSGKLKLFEGWLKALDPDEKDAIYQDFKGRVDSKHSLPQKFDFIDLFHRYGGQKMKRPGKYPGIVLSTVHSAKGLEWPVCIVSLSKFEPYRLDSLQLEEKRRLLFVAATRAREELILTGQYVAYKQKENKLAKRATVYRNGLLKESFEILGLPYDPVDHSKSKA